MWAQAAAVGALMLPPVAARRLEVSTSLCPSAGARYAHAVSGMCALVACVLPPALGAAVWDVTLQLPDAAAYHMLSGLAQLLLSFAAPLAVLASREHRARLEFAAARRHGAAVAGLARWRQRWRLSAFEWSLLAAWLWCLSLYAAKFYGVP